MGEHADSQATDPRFDPGRAPALQKSRIKNQKSKIKCMKTVRRGNNLFLEAHFRHIFFFAVVLVVVSSIGRSRRRRGQPSCGLTLAAATVSKPLSLKTDGKNN